MATGVHVGTSEVERAPRIFSDPGAQATVGRLLPHGFRREEWVREILSLSPSCGHAVLYLGLEGDIRRHGATPANYFIHESWDLGAAVIWRDTFADAPGSLFVSFPSLKDPAHRPGDPAHHTAEVLVPIAQAVAGRKLRDFTNADLRAMTRIQLDGDTLNVVPERSGQIDEKLWAIHDAMVVQAQANRAEMLKTAVSLLGSLKGL